MINIRLAEKSLWDTHVEGYLFLIQDEFKHATDLDYIEENFYPHLKEILRKHKFVGKRGQSFVLTANRDGKLVQFVFVGIGKLCTDKKNNIEIVRRAIGTCGHEIKRLALKSAVLHVKDAHMFGIDTAELVKQIAITAHLARYEFVTFKSEKKEALQTELFLVIDDSNRDVIDAYLREGNIIGRAANHIRDFCDMPPNIVTPEFLSAEAKMMANEFGLAYTVLHPDKAKELGMGGFWAVQSGSDNSGRMVILEYQTQEKRAPTIGLVGKGVTFDSGGISLKPWTSMTGMKYDMSGAAAVLGAMRAIAELKPAVNVVAITPLVENMPSGKSSRQDDIVTFMNGKTAEIKSTDAEGRLILADALCYMEKVFNPEVILDIATLTGACSVALGLYYSAVMSHDQELVDMLKEVGQTSGDRLWQLPFDEDYMASIKSDVADLANCGKSEYGAGTITAGLFLSQFVSKARWAHLDIAGTADGVLGVNYLGRGATGVGVRLFVEFIKRYAQEK